MGETASITPWDIDRAYQQACRDLIFMAQDQQWPNADWLIAQYERLAIAGTGHWLRGMGYKKNKREERRLARQFPELFGED